VTTAEERIRRHAGLGEPSLASDTVSAATSDGNPGDIDSAASDFVAALNDYNRDLNEAVPSSSVKSGSDSVPRDVAYAVGEVTRMLRESGANRSAWRVETAWLAVLAGDIDDLAEHLAEEEAARGG
jgi:hypothetical protein